MHSGIGCKQIATKPRALFSVNTISCRSDLTETVKQLLTSHWRPSTTHVVLRISPVRVVLWLIPTVVDATRIAKSFVSTPHVSTAAATSVSSRNTSPTAAASGVVCQPSRRLNTLIHCRRLTSWHRRRRRFTSERSYNRDQRCPLVPKRISLFLVSVFNWWIFYGHYGPLWTICSAERKSFQMCAELRHCQRWITNRERQRVPQ